MAHVDLTTDTVTFVCPAPGCSLVRTAHESTRDILAGLRCAEHGGLLVETS